MTVFMVLITVLANIFANVHILPTVNRILVPLVFVATLITAYFAFKDRISIERKWVWVCIAVQAGMALKNLGYVVQLMDRPESPALQVIGGLLAAAGGAAVVTTLLDKKFYQYLPYAFGGLALSAIVFTIDADFALVNIAQILLYAAFSVITLNVLPMCNRLIRVAAIILAVISLPSVGLVVAISWIVFAFVLVPAGKCNFRLTFGKFAAILCVVTLVFAVFTFVDGKPLAEVKYCKEQIALTQEKIEKAEDDIQKISTSLAKYNSQLEQMQTSLTEAEANLADAEAGVEDANANMEKAVKDLAEVCKRSSYNYWYCSPDCRSQHMAVDNSKTAISDAEAFVDECLNKIYEIESQIEDTKYDIETGEDKLTQLGEEIEDLEKTKADYRSRQVSNWFIVLMEVVAILLCVGALLCLAVCLFKLSYGKYAFISCGALATGALLYLLLGSSAATLGIAKLGVGLAFLRRMSTIVYLLASPYFWTIVIAGLLAVIFAKKEGKLVKYRVLIIIASILTAATSGSVVGILFAVTMIVTALVLVPPVFTEEISIAKHIFFTIISLGIWVLIWTYHVTKNLNKVAGMKRRDPRKELLLCMILPLYYAFWLMKTGEYMEAYARENGKQCKLEIICLVFACILPFVSTILIQNKINMIVEKAE